MVCGKVKNSTVVVARGIQNHWPQPAPVGTSAQLCQQGPTPLTTKFNHGWMKHWRMHCRRFVLLGAEPQAHFDSFVILNVHFYYPHGCCSERWSPPPVTLEAGRSLTAWLKCLSKHANLPRSSNVPTVSFQRLKPSQGLLFPAGVLDIWLKEKRILLFYTVERVQCYASAMIWEEEDFSMSF